MHVRSLLPIECENLELGWKKDNFNAEEGPALFSSVLAFWLSMRTHNTGVVSSIPPCVTFKTPLVMKATGNHLMNSTSLEKNSEPCLWFLLRSKSSMQWNLNSVSREAAGNIFSLHISFTGGQGLRRPHARFLPALSLCPSSSKWVHILKMEAKCIEEGIQPP